jgi:hypothetical protein
MPQIPTYDGPQVALKPLQYDQANADMFGAQRGRDLAQAGTGVMNAGTVLDKINEREVQTQVFSAEAKAKEAYIAWAQDAANNRQGAAAKGLTKDAADWWGKAQEEFGKDLSPMAQRMLGRSLATQALAAKQTMGAYENQQGELALQNSLKLTTKGSIDSAVANPSETNIQIQGDNIRGAWAQMRGRFKTDEDFNTAVRGELSQMHQGVFNKLVVVNPAAAKAYYEAHQNEISGSAKDEMDKQLKAGIAAQTGGAAAREVIAELTAGRKPGDVFPEKEADAKLVARFENDPTTLAAARQELRHQAVLTHNSEVAASAANTKTVFGMAITQRMPMAQVEASQAFQQLSPADQALAKKQIIDYQHAMFSTSVSNRQLALNKLELDNAQGTWELLNDPQRLAAMTQDEVNRLPLSIGPISAAKVVAARQHLVQSQAHLEDAKLDSDMFKSIASGAGYNVAAPARAEEAKELVRLRDSVESEIRRRQQAAKRPLFDHEKREAMQSVIDNKVITEGLFGSEKPAASLTSEQVKGSRVKVATAYDTNKKPTAFQTVELKDIPKEFKEEAIRTLNGKGVRATEQLIAQAWWDKKNRASQD